jgi:LysM repeat protein
MIDLTTMKLQIKLPLSCSLLWMLGACANQNQTAQNDPYGTGPFDSQGNYREEWADDPTKWRRPGSRQKPVDDLPAFAANERPPAHASPLPPSRPAVSRPSATTPSRPAQTAAAKPKPKPVAAKPKPSTLTYTVKKGDTLSGIASRHRSSVVAIQRANGITGSLIFPGQKLKVPQR